MPGVLAESPQSGVVVPLVIDLTSKADPYTLSTVEALAPAVIFIGTTATLRTVIMPIAGLPTVWNKSQQQVKLRTAGAPGREIVLPLGAVRLIAVSGSDISASTLELGSSFSFDPSILPYVSLWVEAGSGSQVMEGGVYRAAVAGEAVQRRTNKVTGGVALDQTTLGARATLSSNAGLIGLSYSGAQHYPTTLNCGRKPITLAAVLQLPASPTNSRAIFSSSVAGGLVLRLDGLGRRPALLKANTLAFSVATADLSSTRPSIAYATYSESGAFEYWVDGFLAGSGVNNQTFNSGLHFLYGAGSEAAWIGTEFETLRCDIVLDATSRGELFAYWKGKYNIP